MKFTRKDHIVFGSVTVLALGVLAYAGYLGLYFTFSIINGGPLH